MNSFLLSISKNCIAIIFLTLPAVAQQVDDIKAKAQYGFKNEELKVLAELDQIDHYKVSFEKKTLKGNPFLLFITKEYSKGKVVKQDTLIPPTYAKQFWKFKNIDSNSLITLTTKPQGDSVKFLYRIMDNSFTRTYKRINNELYSLRDGLVTNEEFKSIPVNKTLPLFAYSLPYNDPKKPDYSFYCVITSEGIPPEKWWETYKIPHFIIVEMKIVSEK